MDFEDKYLGVLQNIEFMVAQSYREHPDLSDYDVMRVYEALIDSYRLEGKGQTPKEFNGSANEMVLLERVRKACEWNLGRGRLETVANEDEEQDEDVRPEPRTVEEILLCLKKLRKSVTTWNKMGGRQAYLDFISPFLP